MNSYNDDHDDDEDDDDDIDIDVDSLGDWRSFRRNLAAAAATTTTASDEASSTTTTEDAATTAASAAAADRRCIENERLLRTQNKVLADEYNKGVWAHITATPEVGGMVCRLPLEVEICRNYKHSLIGKKLRTLMFPPATPLVSDSDDSSDMSSSTTKTIRQWYASAHSLVETEMQAIVESAQGPGGVGQVIDASSLNHEAAEMLQLYIDNQECWQEVCLVLDRNDQRGTCTTVVLNRPMALQLTENLARLVLHGIAASSSFLGSSSSQRKQDDDDVVKFIMAFGRECAIYSGGTDGQEEPAIMLHGISNLPGAVEISPNCGIYRGGSMAAAVDGVLEGKYKPLDFRFFVGRHDYQEHMLDVKVLLGKYQPIACARSLALKQCISLPKPLWHEVLELCGGELKEISELEMLKRNDLSFQIVEEDDDDNDNELSNNNGLDIEAIDIDDEDEDEFFV